MMSSKTPSEPLVVEKDIDTVLAEVLHDKGFVSWFVGRLLGERFKAFIGDPHVSTQQHHKSDRLCIVDVQVCLSYRSDPSQASPGSQSSPIHKVFLLIENKLTADLSYEQAEKYLRAKQNLMQREHCLAFSILVAPSAYLERKHSVAESFDYKISYEEIYLSSLGQQPRLAEALMKSELQLGGIADRLDIVNKITQLMTEKLDVSHRVMHESFTRIQNQWSIVSDHGLKLQAVEDKIDRLWRTYVAGAATLGGVLLTLGLVLMFR